MLMFWAVVVVLLAVVLGLILPVLMRSNTVVKNDANTEKRAIFRQQFEELEQDKINGVLEATQYEAAKTELERRMLDEVGITHETAALNSSPDRRLAYVLLMALPLAAVLLYLKIGSPASITIPVQAPDAVGTPMEAAEHSAMAGNIEPLLEILRKKLESNPTDGAGWALLARSYIETRRFTEAVPAYEKAANLITDDPQLLADYADALAVVNGRNLTGKPEELIHLALKLDPHHPKALMLAASAAFNRKDYKQAIVFWERVQQDLPAGSDALPAVKAALADAYALSGETASIEKNSKPASNSSASIDGTVRIAPALANKLDPFSTVFIYARAAQGSPMPLAIVRTKVRDLPYAYHLDDTASLMPGHKLSQASEVVMVARVSKTGDATAKTGDLQGMSVAVKPDGGLMDIEINQIVP